MKLLELLKDIPVLESNVSMDLDIAHVAYDSRKVTSGGLFVAITGFAADGNRFIPMALEKGAAAVVTAKKPEGDVPYILVESDRQALALIGCNFYGHPARSMKMVGVTGTNGKTSVTLILKHVLEKTLGAKVGLIGTTANMIGDEVIPTERTTPESFELQGLFARMRDAGCTHVVMEVSSHAIALDRVAGVRFDAAAFTNLTEDHLDFHKTMDDYCDTKAELFRRCKKGVINCDDSYARRFLDAASCEVLTTSVAGEGTLSAKNLELRSDGIVFDAVLGGKSVPVRLGIPGKFTVYNALTVLGLAVSLGISLKRAAGALADAPGVKGRVEVVPTPAPATPSSSTTPTPPTDWKMSCPPSGASAPVGSSPSSAAAATVTPSSAPLWARSARGWRISPSSPPTIPAPSPPRPSSPISPPAQTAPASPTRWSSTASRPSAAP